MNRRGLFGSAFTVAIGSDGVPLTVPHGLLETIPQFQARLEGNTDGKQSLRFELPELNPDAVADVIHLANNPQEDVEFPISDCQTDDAALSMLKQNLEVYVTAVQLKAEDVANRTVDGFSEYHSG